MLLRDADLVVLPETPDLALHRLKDVEVEIANGESIADGSADDFARRTALGAQQRREIGVRERLAWRPGEKRLCLYGIRRKRGADVLTSERCVVFRELCPEHVAQDLEIFLQVAPRDAPRLEHLSR